MRIVVKIGSSTLAHPTGRMNIRRVAELCRVLSDLKNAGHEIILVSSGAIAMGVGKLSMTSRPHDTPTKQAAASIGQCELMYTYNKEFAEYNHTVAQILLTRDIVDSPQRKENVVNTFRNLLGMGVIPVVNENDTVAVEEIEFGDNDTLSAIVGSLTDADLLVILTDIDGVYEENPRLNPAAKMIPRIPAITEEVRALAGGNGTGLGTGGMVTKLSAAQIGLEAGFPTVIMNGSRPEALYDLMDGREIGTFIG